MQIDREDILAVVTSNNESKIFDLANLLLSGRYSDAYCQLDVLFQNNEEPVVILSILASNIINVYRMKCATENGMSLSEVSETFKYGNREFQLKSAGRFTGKYSRVQLEHIMVEVLKTDLLLKSSAASKKQAQRVIENCFAKIILISNN